MQAGDGEAKEKVGDGTDDVQAKGGRRHKTKIAADQTRQIADCRRLLEPGALCVSDVNVRRLKGTPVGDHGLCTCTTN